MARRTLSEIYDSVGPVGTFVRQRRKTLGYSQLKLSECTGVGLRFIRELEQGKQTLRLDKINQVLAYFGYQVGPIEVPRELSDD